MPQPLILYSAVTKLAYNLAQKYYGQTHYVWCAPRPEADPHAFSNPPSSDPISIYWRYHDDVVQGDQHSPLVAQNRRGLLQGASVREQQGLIDARSRELIEAVVGAAASDAFSPLLLVIPYARVRRIVKAAALKDRARATSEEYVIENLPRACFDVLQMHR